MRIQRSSRRRVTISLIVCVFVLGAIAAPVIAQQTTHVRITSSFDRDWRFLKGDAAGADKQEFNDSSWRQLDVPHDWSIAGPVDEKNPTGQGGGFMPSGIGWYRKHFTVSSDLRDRLVFIEFDGVMANSDVWINGFHLGRRPYGYVSFGYQLTPHINFGQDNVIAVRADTSKQPASRWYTGAGIYRHVRLVIKNGVNIPQWGTVVSTSRTGEKEPVVWVYSEVINQSASAQDVSVQVTLRGPTGKVVRESESPVRTIEPGRTLSIDNSVVVTDPIRWNLSSPAIYTATAKVRVNGQTVDDDAVSFG